VGQRCGAGSPPPSLPSCPCEDEVDGVPPELLESPWLPPLEDGLPADPLSPDDWLVLPGTPWLPDEPELPEEPGLPGDPDDGEELGMDGGEEDVDSLVVAQPAIAKAPASASTRHVHDCLRVISPDSVAQGRCTASR